LNDVELGLLNAFAHPVTVNDVDKSLIASHTTKLYSGMLEYDDDDDDDDERSSMRGRKGVVP